MKNYKIRVYYQTGDTKGYEEVVKDLPFSWDKLAVAKKNLKRIEEHYIWYRYVRHKGWNPQPAEEPEWHKKATYEQEIEILLADGNIKVPYGADWCGYFETLHTAEIIEEDPDMKVTFD